MKFGIGWREEVLTEISEQINNIDVIEILADQYMFDLRKKVEILKKALPKKEIIFHCVNLSIGSSELDLDYLHELKRLVDIFDPTIVSDHIGITRYKYYDTGIACPVSYNSKTLKTFEANIKKFQKIIGKPLILENISSPLKPLKEEFSEAEFIAKLYQASGVNILLDVTNLYINSKNYNFDCREWLDKVPISSVRQLHLAGGNEVDGKLWDSHCCAVAENNWHIYKMVVNLFSNIEFVVVERDRRYDNFYESINDVFKAKDILLKYKYFAQGND
nr:DUF692 family multinuclear iron-containing protein [Clostridium chromiireducens]